MRWAALLPVVAACGRIAFDPRGDAEAPDAMQCPAGYTFDTGSCYRTSTTIATWLGAEADCEADGLGAHLVVIENATEAQVVNAYLPSPTDFAWIGTTDAVTEGTYVTVTNRAAPYVVFGSGEPEGAPQDCLVLNANFETSDAVCTNPDDYICEYDGIPANSAVWGVCPAGYTLLSTGCYRFKSTVAAPTDWFTAEAQCEADAVGAHLVVLDNLAEANAVDTFVPGTIIDHWVGATDIVNEGVFPSVTNGPFGFINWDTGEPDGATAQNCVIFTDATVLQTSDCASGDDYVCEYDGIPAVPASWGQ